MAENSLSTAIPAEIKTITSKLTEVLHGDFVEDEIVSSQWSTEEDVCTSLRETVSNLIAVQEELIACSTIASYLLGQTTSSTTGSQTRSSTALTSRTGAGVSSNFGPMNADTFSDSHMIDNAAELINAAQYPFSTICASFPSPNNAVNYTFDIVSLPTIDMEAVNNAEKRKYSADVANTVAEPGSNRTNTLAEKQKQQQNKARRSRLKLPGAQFKVPVVPSRQRKR